MRQGTRSRVGIELRVGAKEYYSYNRKDVGTRAVLTIPDPPPPHTHLEGSEPARVRGTNGCGIKRFVGSPAWGTYPVPFDPKPRKRRLVPPEGVSAVHAPSEGRDWSGLGPTISCQLPSRPGHHPSPIPMRNRTGRCSVGGSWLPFFPVPCPQSGYLPVGRPLDWPHPHTRPGTPRGAVTAHARATDTHKRTERVLWGHGQRDGPPTTRTPGGELHEGGTTIIREHDRVGTELHCAIQRWRLELAVCESFHQPSPPTGQGLE